MNLSDKERSHKELMVSILKGLSDTPLVLKGETALFLGYGLTRFSEYLDFDAPRKLNLFSKIKNSIPSTIELNDIHIKKDTQTVSRYIVDYYIPKLKESAKMLLSTFFGLTELISVRSHSRYLYGARPLAIAVWMMV